MINFGFEIEFFGTRGAKVFNAEKLIRKFNYDRLRLDILRKGKYEHDTLNFKISPNTLLTGTPYNIISDGTAFEIVATAFACISAMRNGQAANELNHSLGRVRECVSELFDIDTLVAPYVSSDDFEFIDPGWVNASDKRNHNAYTGENWISDKKSGDETVTFRTAGFHIHIRFDKSDADKIFKGMYAPPLCNKLIIELDKVYRKYFPNCYSSNKLRGQEQQRNEKFARMGDYRLKYHQTPYDNFTTLEYRQFSAAFFLLPIEIQCSILRDFGNTVQRFVSNLP